MDTFLSLGLTPRRRKILRGCYSLSESNCEERASGDVDRRLFRDLVRLPLLFCEHDCVSLLPPIERQRVVGGEVADPGLEGGQVAVLRPHVAVC